jgi:tRNA-2-methylthio-N6-dimethylallyladenosine synthase
MDNTKKIGFNKRFFIKTYGCDANKRDSEFISGILEKLGFKKTENVNDAHLFLLNTCAIREGAEEKVFGRIGFLKEIKKNNKNIKIGICGCMVHEKNVVKKILAIKHVDFIMGTNDISKLETILHDLYDENKKNFQILNNFNTIYENLPSKRFSKIKAFVNITYGCSNFCTYCIVPYTRGPMRSRKKEVIINEIKHLIKIGYQEIILLGQNVNSYGVDFKEKYFFNDLLSDIAKLKIPRIRFSTSNPWNFTKEIVDVMKKYKNIMPSIHLPIQSGSEEILKKMNR